MPPIPSEDDSEYSEPDENNPYDFRRFIVKTPKSAREEEDSPPPIVEDQPYVPPRKPKAPVQRKKAQPNAFNTGAEKPSPKPKAAPKKAAPKKAAPAKKPPPPPPAEEKEKPAKSSASLLLPANAPSPAAVEESRPKSLKELMAEQRAAEGGDASESDADDESGSDDGGLDFVVEGDEDDAPKSLFGGRKLNLGKGGPTSLKASPLGILGNRRPQRDESSDDEIMVDAPEESDADEQEAQEEEEDDEDEGFDLEKELETALADEDDEDDGGAPTPAGAGYQMPPVQGYVYARRQDDESSSEEE